MVPPKSHPNYRRLALGEITPHLTCLGLKILMGRVKLQVVKDKSAQNVATQIDAIHEFLVRNDKLASKDIEAIFATP